MLRLAFCVDYYGISDIGLVRKNNEDRWMAIPDCHFYLLADGMGGHNAGEIAATKATELLTEHILAIHQEAQSHTYSAQQIKELIDKAIQKVNAKIYKMGIENLTWKGMGTTICCLYAYQDQAIYAHVGDSRIYRMRKKKPILELLTQDHSLINDLIVLGQITENDAIDFPFKNVLTRSIGASAQVEVTTEITTILSDDIFLLCSDGLTNYCSQNEIQTILQEIYQEFSLKNISQTLIDLAKQHGGADNITVVIIRFKNQL